MSALVLSLPGVLGNGCSADLVDGAYACTGGLCPDGWYCHRDLRCYREPEVLTPLGERCRDDLECDSGLCALSFDLSANDGYCSTECSPTRPCSGEAGADTCIADVCFEGCATCDDCAEGFACVFPTIPGDRMMMSSSASVCMALASPELDGTYSCIRGENTCPTPAACVDHPDFGPTGLCSLRCMSDDNCQDGARCETLFGMARHCLTSCAGPDDCHADLACAPFGEGPDVCIPEGWVGQTPPLPAPDRPPPPSP